MAKPPPPVYAPEVVACSIVYAAGHPRREILVGGAAAAFALAQRLSPALTDAVLSIRRLGAGSQRTDRPDNGVDNLDAPLGGPGRIWGAFPGRVLRSSPFTLLVGHLPRPAELLTAAARRLQAVPAGARTDENAGRSRTVE
jgi:hypothetical protein